MSDRSESQPASSWLESCSFVQIFRSFKLAVHPSKLLLALAALLLTWAWGGILDAIWKAADRGVAETAIWSYVAQRQAPARSQSVEGAEGVFAVWSRHLAWCVESGLASARHGNLWGGGVEAGVAAPVANVGVMPLGLFSCLTMMVKGSAWVITEHALFALLFFLVSLVIWALLGGAICRIAAVQFARGEKIGIGDALKFAWARFFGGFFMAPLLPVLMLLVIAVALAVGGALLRIPYVGDVLGSLFFFLAVLGGFAAALILIGSIAGGSLFWPTVAAEGSESLDAVSRSFNYVGATPWRTLFYGLVAAVYAGLCFLFVRLVTFLTLKATYVLVGFGTSPFGWWRMGEGDASKLELLWPAPTFAQLHPPAELPGGIESFSAWVIGVWVVLVVLLMWAFLASFHLSASTVIYFLLRRANDGMDLEEVYIEHYEEGEFAPSSAPPEPAVASESGAAGGSTADDEPAPASAPGESGG